MKCFLLQDWMVVRGQGTGVGAFVPSVTQSESGWLDLRGYRDLVAWCDVRETTPGFPGGPVIDYQTSIIKEEMMFTSMAGSVNLNPGLTVTPMLQDLAIVPLARWVRWQITQPSSVVASWDVSFRIWLSANAPGRAAGRAAANRTMAARR